jgi:hypothetical protein
MMFGFVELRSFSIEYGRVASDLLRGQGGSVELVVVGRRLPGFFPTVFQTEPSVPAVLA